MKPTNNIVSPHNQPFFDLPLFASENRTAPLHTLTVKAQNVKFERKKKKMLNKSERDKR